MTLKQARATVRAEHATSDEIRQALAVLAMSPNIQDMLIVKEWPDVFDRPAEMC